MSIQQEKMNPAEFIADLYECRAKVTTPLSFREMADPQEMLQYNWLNTIISVLTDKYNVKYEDIKDVLSSRVTYNTK